MRLSHISVLIGLIILLLYSLPAPVMGQDTTDEETLPISEGTVEPVAVNEPPAGDLTDLPEDIPTRESFDPAPIENQPLGPTTAEYFRVLIGLLVVIGVIWGLSVLLKRFVTVRGISGASDTVKVLYTLSLTPTRTLYLIRLGDRILLVGAAEGGLRTLAEIDDPAEVSTVLKELEFKGNFDLNPFKDRLQSMMEAEDTDLDLEDDLDQRQRSLKGTLDRLREISRNDR